MIITVADGGVLGVTQQLSRFGSDFVQNACPQSAQNPFLSPSKSNHHGQDSMSASSAFMSPNNSVLAQHGSPYTSQLSPSPERVVHAGAAGSGDLNTPARSLFPVSRHMSVSRHRSALKDACIVEAIILPLNISV